MSTTTTTPATTMEDRIAEEEKRLASIRTELAELSQLVQKLHVAEKETQDKLFTLKAQRNHIQEHQTRTQVQRLQEEMAKRDQALAELQASYERALEDKMRIHDQILKVTGQNEVKAGAGPRAPDNSMRYELAPKVPIRSGSSADPLAQVPVPTVNPHQQLWQSRTYYQDKLATTDTLGERPNPSPNVNPDEFVVNGPRPSPSNRDQKGGRFSEWRPASSRTRQPPGGASSITLG